MMYLTTDGKVISGVSATAVLEELKNASYCPDHELTQFLDDLLISILFYYDRMIIERGHDHILDQLEEVGFLLSLE